MTDAVIGEIRMFAGDFAPRGWERCLGQNVSTTDPNFAQLFAVIGYDYGGEGDYFTLPDLQGRMPVHRTVDGDLGTYGGAETAGLLAEHLPAHTHALTATKSAATSSSPQGNLLASWPDTPFAESAQGVEMAPGALESVGGNERHPNMPPFVVLTFIICLAGDRPTVA